MSNDDIKNIILEFLQYAHENAETGFYIECFYQKEKEVVNNWVDNICKYGL